MIWKLQLWTPRLVVFFNGQNKMKNEEERILKLSDAFEKPETEPSLECRVRVININCGKNRQMMEKCPKLYEYAYFVGKIRENQVQGKTLEGAIGEAIEDCLAQGYLTELLTNYRREVTGMLLYEYDEKKHLKNTYEEGVKKGVRQGISQGERRRSIRTARNLYRKGYSPREAADILEEDEKTVAVWYKKWSKE